MISYYVTSVKIEYKYIVVNVDGIIKKTFIRFDKVSII